MHTLIIALAAHSIAVSDLLSSTHFWSSLIIALVGGGGIGGLVSSISAKHKNDAEADNLSADAAEKAVDILTDKVIRPLREQLTYQEQQIIKLENVQKKYFIMGAYLRKQAHWLNEFCELMDNDWTVNHPKPRLPDELREDFAQDTSNNQTHE